MRFNDKLKLDTQSSLIQLVFISYLCVVSSVRHGTKPLPSKNVEICVMSQGIYYIRYLQVAERIDYKCSHHKKRNSNYVK